MSTQNNNVSELYLLQCKIKSPENKKLFEGILHLMNPLKWTTLKEHESAISERFKKHGRKWPQENDIWFFCLQKHVLISLSEATPLSI